MPRGYGMGYGSLGGLIFGGVKLADMDPEQLWNYEAAKARNKQKRFDFKNNPALYGPYLQKRAERKVSSTANLSGVIDALEEAIRDANRDQDDETADYLQELLDSEVRLGKRPKGLPQWAVNEYSFQNYIPKPKKFRAAAKNPLTAEELARRRAYRLQHPLQSRKGMAKHYYYDFNGRQAMTEKGNPKTVTEGTAAFENKLRQGLLAKDGQALGQYFSPYQEEMERRSRQQNPSSSKRSNVTPLGRPGSF